MSHIRRIIFRDIALFNPTIYKALYEDNIMSFSHDSQNRIIETLDSRSDDYPVLCEALRAAGFSYSIYRRHDNEGDHVQWNISLAGQPEKHLESATPLFFMAGVSK